MEIKISIKKYLALLAICSVPFTGSFLITEKISISLILFSLVTIFDGQLKRQVVLPVILLMFLMHLSFFFSKINFRSLFYIYSFGFSIVIYSLGAQSIVNNIGVESALKVFRRLLTVTSIILILEFLFINFNIGFEIVLPRRFDSIDNYNPTMLGIFNRSRGFARESGHMGLLYEMLVPIFMFSGSRKFKIFEITLWLIASLTLGSPITMALLLFTLFFRINWKSRMLFIIGLIYLILNSEFLKLYFIKILSWSPSSIDRLNRITAGLDSLKNHLFGVGPLNLDEFDSTLNLYLDLFVFFGVLTGSFFVLCLVFILVKTYKLKLIGLRLSYLFLLFHYLIISNFWYPFIWIISGIILMPKRDVVH